MNPIEEQTQESQPVQSAYEAPRVEAVLTSEDLGREVHYAGVAVSTIS